MQYFVVFCCNAAFIEIALWSTTNQLKAHVSKKDDNYYIMMLISYDYGGYALIMGL